MKKYFILCTFFLFFNFSCQDVPPIVEDICKITADICLYADEICKMFPQSEKTSSLHPLLQSDLTEFRYLLNVNLDKMKNSKSGLTNDDLIETKMELQKIRDDLKHQYEQLLKCEELK